MFYSRSQRLRIEGPREIKVARSDGMTILAVRSLTVAALFGAREYRPFLLSAPRHGGVRDLTIGTLFGWKGRRRWDSNPRITDLQSVPLVHLGTPPRMDSLAANPDDRTNWLCIANRQPVGK